MLRRALVPLLTVVAISSAYGSWDAVTVSDPDPDQDTLGAAVVSPRRLPSLLAEANADAELRAAIRSLVVARALPTSAISCITVSRAGRTVISENADRALIPASTQKVLTASAALEVLGRESRLTTEVKRTRPVRNGTLDGNLYLEGGGDPMLMTPDYVASLRRKPSAFTSIDDLAKSVADSGVRRVTGAIVVDDDRFDEQRLVPSWEAGYRARGEVGAIGALVVNDGLGPYPTGRTASPNPATDAAAALKDALGRNGVAVEGSPLRGNTPEDAEVVATIQSPTVDVIVGHVLSASANTAAEILVKNIAVAEKRPGATTAGVAEVAEAVTGSPADRSALFLVDGSGLDRQNRASCGLVEGTLRADGAGGAVSAGLPRAGETGTLDDRMVGTAAVGRVRAKTGSLAGVTALAGWSMAPDAPISFATISNGVETDASRAFEDDLAVLLATPPPVPAADRFGPDAAPTR